jgi:voltage-gated potassium channel
MLEPMPADHRSVVRFILIERKMSRFLREPVSVRNAASVIVTVTAIIVLASGALMRVLDHREYPNIWLGMWWAIQTVTTVGYGDVTPKDVAGRIVPGAIMLEGIALLVIVTAAVTSTFVERAQSESREAKELERDLDARLDDLAARLARVEAMLRQLTNA